MLNARRCRSGYKPPFPEPAATRNDASLPMKATAWRLAHNRLGKGQADRDTAPTGGAVGQADGDTAPTGGAAGDSELAEQFGADGGADGVL